MQCQYMFYTIDLVKTNLVLMTLMYFYINMKSTLVEKSSNSTMGSTFYRCFQLSRANGNKLVGPIKQPSMETHFY
jgi:hypothetical protein